MNEARTITPQEVKGCTQKKVLDAIAVLNKQSEDAKGLEEIAAKLYGPRVEQANGNGVPPNNGGYFSLMESIADVNADTINLLFAINERL